MARAAWRSGSHADQADGLPSLNRWSLAPASTDASTSEVGGEATCHYRTHAVQQSLYTGCITAIVRRLERLVAVYRARYTLRAAGSPRVPLQIPGAQLRAHRAQGQ